MKMQYTITLTPKEYSIVMEALSSLSRTTKDEYFGAMERNERVKFLIMRFTYLTDESRTDEP